MKAEFWPSNVEVGMAKVCSVEGCGGAFYAKGLCAKCYHAARYVARGEEIRAQNRAYFARYYQENKETLNATTREYYRDNKAALAEKQSVRRKLKPACNRANSAAYRSKKRAAPGRWSFDDQQALLAMAGHKCEKCGCAEDLCLDHIVALKNGGTNWPCNLQVLCRGCNSQKSDRKTEVWLGGVLVGAAEVKKAA